MKPGITRSTPAALASLLALASALALAACASSKSSSTHTTTAVRRSSAPVLCLPAAKELMARTLGVNPGRITQAIGVGTNGNRQCTFVVHPPRHKRVSIIANEYTGPQPYFILERTEIEASQQFTPTRLSPAPQAVSGLGVEAAWFPATQQMMATDAIRLISIDFNWPGASLAQQRRLGIAMARPYLKITKQSQKLSKGYP